MKKNLIVTLSDRGFVRQAKQLFSSVYWHAGWDGDYLLLSHQIPETERAWFQDRGIIVFDCIPLTQGTVGQQGHPATVLDKFYLFTTYFKQWEKIIFLDADIIVRNSLHSLLQYDGFSAPNATSLSFRREFTDTPRALFKNLKKRYPMRGKAFNTGVFVFDTTLITDQTFRDIFSLYTEFGSLNICGEEGTFNIFFYKKWNLLPIIYNSFPTDMKYTYGLDYLHVRATIIHFVASTKPWETDSPYYSEWIENLNKADAIVNFSKPVQVPVSWSDLQKKLYLAKLFIRRIMHVPAVCLIAFPKFIDRNIGRLGILLKKISPVLYARITGK